jgi:Transposase DDE domain
VTRIKAVGQSFTEIRIMDATEFKLPKTVADKFPGYGGKGREAISKIQYEFDLLTGNIKELTIGSALNSDSVEGMKNIDTIPKGSLLIRDLAYFSPKSFELLDSKELFFINRAKSQWNFYSKSGDEYILLSTLEIIRMLKRSKHKYIDLGVYMVNS